MTYVLYEDEYGQPIYDCTSTLIPNVGDIVQIDDETWYTKSRIVRPKEGMVLIYLTEIKPSKATVSESTDSARLRDMQNSIISINKRQDLIEKKSRAIADQVSNIKRQRNERKDNDTR